MKKLEQQDGIVWTETEKKAAYALNLGEYVNGERARGTPDEAMPCLVAEMQMALSAAISQRDYDEAVLSGTDEQLIVEETGKLSDYWEAT